MLKEKAQCLATALLLMALAGCANRAGYIVGASDTLSHEAARARLIQRIETNTAATIQPPLDRPLKVLHLQLADYPGPMVQLGFEGVVKAKFRIEVDGTVKHVHVDGSPPALLEHSVVDAVKTWRFAPLMRGGKPIEIWFSLDFEFRPQ